MEGCAAPYCDELACFIFRIRRASPAGRIETMSTEGQGPSLAKPRWDGNRVVFEIDVGGEVVSCAISRAALQEAGGNRHFAAADLLRYFMQSRARIEAIAAAKYELQPDSVYGVVSLWAEDLDEPAAPAVADVAAVQVA